MKIGSIKPSPNFGDLGWDLEIDGEKCWYIAIPGNSHSNDRPYTELATYALDGPSWKFDAYMPLSDDNPEADLLKFLKLAILQ